MFIPETIAEKKYCFDENCFQSELEFMKQNEEYFSKISENIFSTKDIFYKISSQEIFRLEDFGIFLEE